MYYLSSRSQLDNVFFSSRSQPDNLTISDSESTKDIEEILTGYQIKQTRPVHKQTDTATESRETQVGTNWETEVGRNGETGVGRNGEVDDVIDLENLADPVFIEVEVGKGKFLYLVISLFMTAILYFINFFGFCTQNVKTGILCKYTTEKKPTIKSFCFLFSPF